MHSAKKNPVSSRTPEGGSRRVRAVANIAIAVALIGVAALIAWAVPLFSGGSSSLVAVVHDGDGNVFELPLDEDATLVVSTSLGENVVAVEGGKVRVDSADCPNQDCVEQGSIANASQQIVCLPHELWIEIVEDDTSAEGQSEEQSDDGADGEGFDVIGS